MNTQDITQDQITEARDWASDCKGLVGETVSAERAIAYVKREYPGGWDAFVAEVCVDALVPAAQPAVATQSGYTPCACRDCMDVTVSWAAGTPSRCSLCWEAGCEPYAPNSADYNALPSHMRECQRVDAYEEA